MKQQVEWNIKANIAKLMPNEDTQYNWPSLCNLIEKLKPESGKADVGGIIRDEDGNCIMAYAMSIDCDSHNMAEALAAEFGGKWCNQLGFTNFVLELDSNIIVNMVNQEGNKNRKLKMVADRVTRWVQEANATAQHYYREGNQVADALAKIASISGTRMIYQSFEQLPKEAKGPFMMDKWQMPSIRTKNY
ncbi:uncharacterized protein [Nicotiana sylvestris]|uniref:uncharacterized protein n=1 Tax=Nicotiana sylvestris TaxID=4096 RepID=UPI00388C4391